MVLPFMLLFFSALPSDSAQQSKLVWSVMQMLVGPGSSVGQVAREFHRITSF